MVLKLYGFPISTCTRRVALVCKELNIPYEVILVDLFKGEQKTPEYLEKQPFGQVPAIDDDGFTLYESRAICRYLSAKAKSPLYPLSDPQAHGRFERAASIEQAHFDSVASKLMYEKLRKQAVTGIPPDEKLVQELVDTLNAKLTVYDKILSTQKYLAGDELTLADLFHLPYGHVVESKLGYDCFKTKPNVARWWNEISSRETWQSIKDGA